MATYLQVYNKIKSALTQRTPGTLVNVSLHEEAEIAILDYIELYIVSVNHYIPRSAHSNSSAGVNCELVWNLAFLNLNYDFSVNGFDAQGYPVEITLVEKLSNKIIVKTLVNSSLTATAVAY